VISRVADHCFWFGRYVERAESTARLLAVTHNLALDADLAPAQCWRPVIVVAGEEEAYLAHAPAAAGAAPEAPPSPPVADDPDAPWLGDRVERYLTWSDDSAVSIRRTVAAARWNARQIREVVSREVWETINELHLWLQDPASELEWGERRFDFYRRVRSTTQLCLGLLRSTMLHDEPLDFIWLGVMLERVNQTARILDVQHHALTSLPRHEVIATSLWLSLLRTLSGFEPFMKRNQGRVDAETVAEFLIGEERFPRSVAYCVHQAYERLRAIRPTEATHLPGGRALERLRLLDEQVRERRGRLRSGRALHELLTTVVDETHAACVDLGRELLGAPA
jgi:uncharacterized alpha-E superfamily protein